MTGPASELSPSDLRVGLTAELVRDISAEDVLAFARLSGDENPLHIDAEYARRTNYGRPIVHGAFQISLASALLGMHLPGRRVVLGSVRSRFPAPLVYPCRVSVRGEIASWFPAAQSGVLRVRIVDVDRSILSSEIQMAFGLHEQSGSAAVGAVAAGEASGRDLVVVTGASGAVGRALASHLAGRFDVLAVSRRAAEGQAAPAAAATHVLCDLEDEHWETQLTAAAGSRRVYAVVHAAWPGAPKGGLLELELDTVRRQVEFGAVGTIRLARWLCTLAGDDGRLVLLGSTGATLHPELGLAAYSLGKATLEHTLRLLAPELAPRGITINGVLPSYMPLGMNQAKPSRAALLETARVPAGRLCAPGDVLSAVDYFLSAGASFVTGQVLPLTGGRL